MENNNENNNIETNNIEIDVNQEKPKRSFAKYYKSEAVKRAKAKYYQKMKQNETYMQDMRDRANKYYHEHKKISIIEIESCLPNITA